MAIVLSSTTQTAEQLQETLERAEQRRNPSFGEAAEPVKEVSGETVTESPAVEGETEEHKPSRRSQKVKRLAEKLAQAERERDELREKYETPTQQRRAEVATATEPEDEFAYPVPKPKAADYPNDPQAFVEALTDWKADEREYRNGAKAAADAAQEAHRETADAYNARVAETGIEDFFAVVSKRTDIKLWPQVEEALLEHESGPRVVYYLAKHPEIAQKLAEMRPARAAAEVGVIAASLNASKSPEPKPRPKLITPVGGTVVTEASREKMSFRDYRRGRRNGTIE